MEEQVGQTFRVAEAGTYAGQECEVGDLIIVISDYADSAKDSDFLVVQANVDEFCIILKDCRAEEAAPLVLMLPQMPIS